VNYYKKARDRTEAVRDGLAQAPELAIDLQRPTDAIHRDLRTKWPTVIDLWWELDEDDRTGFVYSGNKILAKLVQS